MLLQFAAILAIGTTDPARRLAADALLGTDGGVCLATGYCTAPGSEPGGAPPGGPMYLALGLVAAGITVLRTRHSQLATRNS